MLPEYFSFDINFSISLLTISSETKEPEFIFEEILIPKSDLFTTINPFSLTKSFKKPVKSTLLGSINIMFKSEFSAFFKANFIPFLSISSLESLMPAVSEIVTG